MTIQFPYTWTPKEIDTRLNPDFWNLPDAQIAGLTDRIGGSWTDRTRPRNLEVLAIHPIGWNRTRGHYEFWNGREWVPLGGGGPTPGQVNMTIIVMVTPASFGIGNWVGVDPAGGTQLTDANDISTEVVGVIGTKLDRTTALVIMAGELGGYTGLTPGAMVFLDSTPGGIVLNPNYSPFPAGIQMIQRVGTVKDDRTITVRLRKVIEIE